MLDNTNSKQSMVPTESNI